MADLKQGSERDMRDMSYGVTLVTPVQCRDTERDIEGVYPFKGYPECHELPVAPKKA